MTAGCAQLQQTKSEQLEKGVHRLSTIGNVFASKEEMNNKIIERASRICGGSENVEYLGEVTVEPFEQETHSEGVSVTGSYQLYSRLIKCKNEQQN